MLPLVRRSLTMLIAAALCAAGPAPLATAQSATSGPFSRAELLAYLRSIPSYQDLSVPYEARKAAHDKLTENLGNTEPTAGTARGATTRTRDPSRIRATASST